MPLSFTKEWLLLCEGGADKGFFKELIRARNLPDFQVQYPIKGSDNSGGWQKFGYFLDTIRVNEDFIRTVKGILLVADNDDDGDSRFKEIQEQVIAGGFTAPTQPLRASTTNGLPKLVILMLPIVGNGNLETLLLPSAYAKWNTLQAQLETYVSQSPCASWPLRKASKAKMQCVVAVTCLQDPNTPLSLLWSSRAPDYHIPVDHASLDGVADVLRNFGSFL